MDKKATALLKIVYLEMFGYDMSWASFHVLEVMSSSRYLQKRAGYLGAVQSFRPDTDVLMLATNLLKKDLISSSTPSLSLPLTTLPHIITPSLAMSLLPDVLSRLSHSRGVVRKKAVVCLYRLALVYPEALKFAWPKLRERLMDDEEESSVTTAVVNVICELGWRRPRDFLPLAPRLFELLVDGGNNWMAIKIIKLFATLTPLEPRLIRKLTGPLMNIIETTTAMSLLYECINGVIQGGILDGDEALEERDEVASLCVGKLRGMIVANSDPNLKYVALLAFNRILLSHPALVSVHCDVIMDCLEDADISIRIQALELAARMVTSDTLQSVVDRLLKQLQDATTFDPVDSRHSAATENLNNQKGPMTLPVSYRIDVMNRILDICSFNNYSDLYDFEWYVDLLVELMKLRPRQTKQFRSPRAIRALECDSGDDIMSRICSEIRNVAVRVKGVRLQATRAAELLISVENRHALFLQPHTDSHALGSLAWVAGEYSACLCTPRRTLQSLIDMSNMSLPAKALSLYVQAVPKVLIQVANDPHQDWNTATACEISLLFAQVIHFLESLAVHPDLDVQERAIEILEMVRLAADALVTERHSSEAMPFLLSSIIPGLFSGLELNPVAIGAQKKVPFPGDLILNEALNQEFPTLLGELDWNPEIDSQHPSQQFYHVADTSNYHSMPIGSATIELYPDSSYQVPEDRPNDLSAAIKRRAERQERNREDPFYIVTEDRPSGASDRDHSISPNSDLDVDSIPIINLDLSTFGDQRGAPLSDSKTRHHKGQRPKKHRVIADETIGLDDSVLPKAADDLDKSKRSLLQVDSSSLGLLTLEGEDRSPSSTLNLGETVQDDAEMVRAMRQVERLRLEMQRASERIHPEGIPVEGTPVRKKKKSKKAKVRGHATANVLRDTTQAEKDRTREM
ncbi:putative AP-3 complex subunit delta [Aspergillus udagawae]|nr:putative AP-3 complex subunit delta [Aspergillus udagawae]